MNGCGCSSRFRWGCVLANLLRISDVESTESTIHYNSDPLLLNKDDQMYIYFTFLHRCSMRKSTSGNEPCGHIRCRIGRHAESSVRAILIVWRCYIGSGFGDLVSHRHYAVLWFRRAEESHLHCGPDRIHALSRRATGRQRRELTCAYDRLPSEPANVLEWIQNLCLIPSIKKARCKIFPT